ncbi:MAG TPA: hypothetical protein ENK18_01345 [Deltaproteobacteria bacterium]|nr:hypothetical protein [Deltaproteobacteria bacterium]
MFLSMADDVGRIGVYVADDGAGALSVVMRGGDEATHSAASLRGLISDLDEMAKVADDAGVDVFVDPNALGRLDALATGPNTRLFLANTEGPSWPIRAGAVHPELGVGPRAWLEVGRLERSALELVLQLASGPLISPSGPIRVLDADCGGATDPALSELSVATHLDEIVGGAQPGEVVWVLAEADPAPGEVAQLARDHGIDLVVLGIGEVCLPDHAVDQGLAPTLEEVHGARTLGQLWSVGRGGASRVITRIEPDASQLGLIGEGLVSVHRLATLQGPAIAAVSLEAAVAGPGPSVVGLDEPEPAPLWFWGLLGVMPVGMIVAGGLLVRTHQHNATS